MLFNNNMCDHFLIKYFTLGNVMSLVLALCFIYIGVLFFFLILGLFLHLGPFIHQEEKIYGVINVRNLNKFSRYKVLASLVLVADIIWFLGYSKNSNSMILIFLGLFINTIFLLLISKMFKYYKKIVKPLILNVPVSKKKNQIEYKNKVMKWRIKMNSAITIVIMFQWLVNIMLFVSLFTNNINPLNGTITSLASYFSFTTLTGIFYYAGTYLIQDVDAIYWRYFEKDYKNWMCDVLK